jgi:micrococcal nuclease
MKQIFILIFLLLSLFIYADDTVKVITVIDGDTITVQFQDGQTERIRLVGIDCPESLKENNSDEYESITDTEYLTRWAVKIKDEVKTWLLGKTVILQYDKLAGRRGFYNRILAYVILDGVNINLSLIEKGYARVYSEAKCELRDELLHAQELAKVEKRGIWSKQDPGDHINLIIPLKVTEVHYDALGNDNENLNDEYFSLKNTSSSSIDLSGWVLSDAQGKHSFRFPEGTSVEPGQTLFIFTGEGMDTKTKVYWNSKRAIWNNDGDKIYLENLKGEIFELYSWK